MTTAYLVTPVGPPPIAKPKAHTAAQPVVQTVPPLENPEEAPGGGTALTVRPTSEWERYWQKLGGDIQDVRYIYIFLYL